MKSAGSPIFLATLIGLFLAALLLLVVNRAPPPMPSAVPSAASTVAPTSAPSPAASSACLPTDQDQFVYHPQRLVVLAACIRVIGTVDRVRHEADGDYHILVAPDPAYAQLVNAANTGQELGDLVVEPVCALAVTQADAIATCKADHDPLAVAGLIVGTHAWLEGRYVTDSDHGGWAELHPLYRWGIQP